MYNVQPMYNMYNQCTTNVQQCTATFTVHTVLKWIVALIGQWIVALIGLW